MAASKRFGYRLVVLFLVMLTPELGLTQKNRSAPKAYQAARKAYFKLKDSQRKQEYRHNWLKVIARFKRVHATHRSTQYGARALYTEAGLWRDLSAISRLNSDLAASIASYQSVVLEYPDNSLADDALFQQAKIYLHRLNKRDHAAWSVRKILKKYPKGDMVRRARKWAAQLKDVPVRKIKEEQVLATGSLRTGRQREDGKLSTVTQIKHWSNRSYSRVAVYLDGPAEVRTGQVARNKSKNRPSRIYIDVQEAKRSKQLAGRTPVNDKLLSQIRTGKRNGNVVRVVLDLKGDLAQHRVITMENPFRVMIDAFEAGSPAKKSQTRQYKVVIDPGHGGKDNGASGKGKLREKDVVLGIALRLKKVLEAKDIKVILTRTKDKFISLEERTALANRSNADVFLSIHANSHDNPKINGVETYYLDTTDDDYSIRLAALENKTQKDRVSDVQLALADISAKAYTKESQKLAKAVQSRLFKQVKAANPTSRNLGVKPSLFYVLLGARMPAVLVETSFISNRQEAKLLRSTKHQRKLAEAIGKAVINYLEKRGT